ncbi:HNH endonuclease signature motif containing protein [Pseudomonas sp.]|uniref:HNH endonuclease signature motif containing protein n=1 Tax=Pseudomonas sp. TaxID=306 RepID=UPI003FD8DB32
MKIDSHGYFAISLHVAGSYDKAHVHRLMAESFFGDPPTPQHEAAHGDGIKSNIRLSNLRWATAKENAADRSAHGRWVHDFGEKHPMAKLTVPEVISLRRTHFEGGQSIKSIAGQVGRPYLTVYDAVTGKTWRSVPDYLEE